MRHRSPGAAAPVPQDEVDRMLGQLRVAVERQDELEVRRLRERLAALVSHAYAA